MFCNKIGVQKTPVLDSLFNKRLRYRYFPVNFAKLFRTTFLHNTSGGRKAEDKYISKRNICGEWVNYIDLLYFRHCDLL